MNDLTRIANNKLIIDFSLPDVRNNISSPSLIRAPDEAFSRLSFFKKISEGCQSPSVFLIDTVDHLKMRTSSQKQINNCFVHVSIRRVRSN